ncbi:hypothetical protein [Klebsiella pneumoniae]|uniref:hypothetical protein n=1 Tax=Klebsiella pneumoniae TaxID=573 RepID=UPI001F5AA86A|nr:hypothetical protein [Klebsiella pneumoniae]
MKKYLICLFVFLASCSSGKIEFYPSGGRLKNAKIGTFYQQGLVMRFQGSGEVISFVSSNFRAKLTPDNSGLDIEPSFMGNEKNDFKKGSSPNELVISGVPRIKGVITVEIVAKTYASMYSKSQAFTKKYQINVD